MKYKKLSQLRDIYPAESNNPSNVSAFYTAEPPNNVKFTGKYPQNFLTFTLAPLDDIDVASIQVVGSTTTGVSTISRPDAYLDVNDPINFRFIIQFVDNGNITEYTSQAFMQDLRSALSENNPYFTKDKVTIAKVDYGFLRTYWRADEFTIREKYAEVTVLNDIPNSIITIEGMITHINWLVSSKSPSDELRPIQQLGNFRLNTTRDLGMSFANQVAELDGTANIANDIPNIAELIPEAIVTSTSGVRSGGRNNQNTGGTRSN